MNEHGPIQQACDEYLSYVNSSDFCEDGMEDYENAIIEAAMEFYCPGFYEKLNKRLSYERE